MFTQIPRELPTTPLLDRIHNPQQLRQLTVSQLAQLAMELRAFLLYTVGQTGGHFGAGLGVVELTIALHYVFQTPDDRLLWDVGHQSYPHKILTERRDCMGTLRQQQGISAFPNRAESAYDAFGVGHSSTSISAALGMAIALRHLKKKQQCIAVIGDGAMTAGMAFEALNHAAHENANLLVILNDNDMSISKNTGGFSNYLGKVLSSTAYHRLRENSKKILDKLPKTRELVRRTEGHMKGMVSAPSTLFEELGFHYIGPVDGHDLPQLVETLSQIKHLDGPQFLHVTTVKGKGFTPAEQDPIGYHAITKLEPAPVANPHRLKFSNIFGVWLCHMAQQDERLMGITPAMTEGSGMNDFAQDFGPRFFDVAICEQHALTLAAGMACEGLKPVVAIYSTFLQRGYDQLIHDVALQNLDVLLAIDRAGLVGEDGPTHAGCYDIAYLRCIPNMVVMTPADEYETQQLLSTGYQYNGPASVRYPRGYGAGLPYRADDLNTVPIGQAQVRREGSEVALLVFGTLLSTAMQVGETLDASVVNMRFVKPLDEAIIHTMAKSHKLLVTLEEGCLPAGAGSAVNECILQQGITVAVMNLGLPDRFIEQGKPADLLAQCGLDASGIIASIKKRLLACEASSAKPTLDTDNNDITLQGCL